MSADKEQLKRPFGLVPLRGCAEFRPATSTTSAVHPHGVGSGHPTNGERVRPTRRPAVLAAATVTATAVLGLAAPGVAAAAPSPDVVVAEVYGGGGNAGATLTN